MRSPLGSGAQSPVAVARVSCQTTRTSECGSEVTFAEPRKGRVKREPGSKEVEEPGVAGQCLRALGVLRGPAELEKGRAVSRQHRPGQRLGTERPRLEGPERITEKGIFQQTSAESGSVSIPNRCIRYSLCSPGGVPF